MKTHGQVDVEGAVQDGILKVAEGGERDIADVTSIDTALQEDADMK